MGDDGEKFGAWPTTWEHCWGESRWVERFFEALEANADWLTTTTPSAWLADHPPIGRVYVPTGLIRRDGRVGAAARREPRLRRSAPPRAGGGPTRGALAAWARSGATSRSSTARSTTSTSRCCGSRPPSRRCRTARPASGRSTTSTRASRTTATGTGCSAGSTSATCGWPRTSTSSPPRTSPKRPAAPSSPRSCSDLDMDGVDEVRLADAGQVVTVDLDGGAGIGGWDIRPVRHALAAVMRRRPEAYHEAIRFARRGRRAVAPADGRRQRSSVSIHDVVRVKEPGLARASGLRRATSGDPDSSASSRRDATPEDWATARADELGDAVDGAFAVVRPGARPARHATRRDDRRATVRAVTRRSPSAATGAPRP